MSDVPVQIIVAAFNTPDGAQKAMDTLKQAKKEHYIAIEDAAVVVKDANGKLKITDSKHRGTKGMITGGVIGGVIGLLAGPVGWLAVGGGVIGALAGKAAGSPMKKEMQDIGQALTPNTSAIVAVIDLKWVAQLQAELAAEGAKVVHDSIKADIAEQLKAGGNVAYTVVGTSSGVAAGRVAETKGTTEVSGVAATDQGVLIEDATLTQEPLPSGDATTPATKPETKPSGSDQPAKK
jgi:uncharacterized membrane protein